MLHKAQHSLIVVLVKTCPCFCSGKWTKKGKTTKREKLHSIDSFSYLPCVIVVGTLLQLLLQGLLVFVSSLFACYKTKGGIQRIMMLVELRRKNVYKNIFHLVILLLTLWRQEETRNDSCSENETKKLVHRLFCPLICLNCCMTPITSYNGLKSVLLLLSSILWKDKRCDGICRIRNAD